ncbi:glucose-6-phosphate isomerase [Parasphaerochaeta coccoides]|uniref:Glucose-6-phosphate isomerase n=1 Tax=Parasphaerochaeta coccoides (strain ATCC BAA-1237 / DSM 17374 / SPN1) TaxID=760011 RepID=F4GLU3_PARC1|nr:glucose-6-phosphate isomerase [Parasphaerochaeta coccoides]AEC02984.1 glucose-6-phosphate isomerase [Parasphaerochaeta coccoides DSM 17374]
MTYKNLDQSTAFAAVSALAPADIRTTLDPERFASCSIPAGGGLTYSYAAMPVVKSHIDALQSLSDDQEVIAKYTALLSGEIMNTGEKRLVLHHLLRGRVPGASETVMADGEEKGAFYAAELEKTRAFAAQVRDGRITGSTGKTFRTVVQIGIGGSDLGPRALYLALKDWALGEGIQRLEARFISNVDPDDAADVLDGLDMERTLFILVSKSGTTQETLTNRDLVIQAMHKKKITGLNPAKHMVAVTSKTSPLATSKNVLASFFFDDYIGGRYSSSSAVGGVVLSLAFGHETFARFLEGAHQADAKALEKDVTKNAALLDALIGVYLRNVLNCPVTAVLPYSQALSRFPAHLQQLDMESNGKSVNRDGVPVSYKTGPVVFGEPGTNGQHSFYQLLHQGTDIIPLQFIGFSRSQAGQDIVTDGSTSQQKLNANLSAQIVAFARGKDDGNPNKRFAGGRWSSLLHGERLTPESLGALLAHYENKVMFQGFLWNINSFDQEGVQLGKVLAGKVLAGSQGDPVLAACAKMLS